MLLQLLIVAFLFPVLIVKLFWPSKLMPMSILALRLLTTCIWLIAAVQHSFLGKYKLMVA